MRRSSLAALAAAVALAGCPLPQPLPSYPAGTVTPPRILADSTTSGAVSLLTVPAGCAAGPSYDLTARIFYQTRENVEARWFVDYRPDVSSRYVVQNTLREVPADPNQFVLERQVPTFTFRPYDFAPAAELNAGSASGSAPGVVHVVELVVSTGFDPSPSAAEPNRSPGTTPDGSTFEIQAYRWVFVTVAGLACP